MKPCLQSPFRSQVKRPQPPRFPFILFFFIFLRSSEQQGGCSQRPVVLNELTVQFMGQLCNDKDFFEINLLCTTLFPFK